MEQRGLRRYIQGMAPGDYEKLILPHGLALVSGECAAGDGRVEHGHPFVIRYSTDGTPGGIFHTRCAPTGPQWFGVEGEE